MTDTIPCRQAREDVVLVRRSQFTRHQRNSHNSSQSLVGWQPWETCQPIHHASGRLRGYNPREPLRTAPLAVPHRGVALPPIRRPDKSGSPAGRGSQIRRIPRRTTRERLLRGPTSRVALLMENHVLSPRRTFHREVVNPSTFLLALVKQPIDSLSKQSNTLWLA